MTNKHIEFYAFGYNKYNLYGTTRSIHAEIDAIKKLKKNIVLEIYIFWFVFSFHF